MSKYKMWIGGEWVDANSGKTYTAVNPATGEDIAQIPMGDRTDVDRAVAAAQAAFPIWSKKSKQERIETLNLIAANIREFAEEFKHIEIIDHGTPVSKSSMWADEAAQRFEYAAQIIMTLSGDFVPCGPDNLSYIAYEPVGVCAIITPWNVPLLTIATKLAPALAAGNTCVVKPPTVDSLSGLILAKALEKSNLPPGTVNIITGPGGVVGNYLGSHPGIDKVGFIGSSDTGKSLIAASSSTMKRLSLELGGKNPFIVLEDADIDAAVAGGVFSSFFNSGQICASPGIYYVHENIYDEFVEKYVKAASKIIVGDPSDEKTEMGPMVSADQRNQVESYIKSGIEEGAQLRLGGVRPSTPPLDKGYYVTPTVFSHVTRDMKIAREEIFGPVACIAKFSSEKQVVTDANDNPFGLCASIWSKDLARAIKMVPEIKAGWVWVNQHMILPTELPWGGYKESGIGKDNSRYSVEEFMQKKAVYISLSSAADKP